MPLLGAHMSIAGGLDRALHRGKEAGCDVIQVFTGSSRQWRSRELEAREIDAFQHAREQTAVQPLAAHANYLINLASPRPEVFEPSLGALEAELDRVSLLGIPYVVLHPGAHLGSGERAGLKRITEALNRVLERGGTAGPSILLETTAGQGTGVGHRLEHLAEIIRGCEQGERLGVCLDTCHAFAAGYDYCSPSAYTRFLETFDGELGLERLKLFHVNDSKEPLASRIDRHEHLGRGCIGLKAMARFVRDPRFSRLAFILETPKGKDGQGRDWDRKNLACLRAAEQQKENP